MKTNALILLMTVFISGLAQQLPVNNQDYSARLAKSIKMKRVGIGLTLAGSVLLIATPILVASSSSFNDTPTYVAAGTLVAGTACIVPGLPLAIIGSRKSKKYSQKINSVSLNIGLVPSGQGTLNFSLRF
jgi:hypothetical protein